MPLSSNSTILKLTLPLTEAERIAFSSGNLLRIAVSPRRQLILPSHAIMVSMDSTKTITTSECGWKTLPALMPRDSSKTSRAIEPSRRARRAACVLFSALVAFAFLVPLTACHASEEAVVSQRVTDAIAAFQKGDEAAQNALLDADNNPFLGFGVSDKDAAATLLKHFSYSLGTVTVNEGGETAQVVVHAQNVDIKQLMQDATQKTMDDAITMQSTTDNQEEIEQNLSKGILDAAGADDAQTISADVTVNLKKENGSWSFVDPAEILNVLLAGKTI